MKKRSLVATLCRDDNCEHNVGADRCVCPKISKMKVALATSTTPAAIGRRSRGIWYVIERQQEE
ncbi:MAG: hypothetical protein IJB01_02305 [Bacteroidaceae bacterium]|nr:hypothetical protein [Bacteroidaceae bacterium]